MPTRVQNQNHRQPEAHSPLKPHDDIHSKNWAHKEALQIALGSILTPKRPHAPPSSRSTSGTLSPVHSGASTPGTGTPVHPPPFGSEYLHSHHAYLYREGHHPASHTSHTPSKLVQSSTSPSQEGSPRGSAPSSPTITKQQMMSPIHEPDDTIRSAPITRDSYVSPPSPGLGPIDDSDPRLRPLRPTLAPLQPQQVNGVNVKAASLPDLPTTKSHLPPPATAIGTPKAKFFTALQGKGAWDALIHGSFS
ncbi:hypothetical protein DFP72DRAFT_912775 [Ephemerocybe angulata]|uniref:Uncharacterized protein n=1 Tax=Ephemerocybe angulata TaxID=980116 RepID=A0A8H6HNC3_9AGAR|nr:hypothetical protein DFP72DRAFT_912775 [Tulosesus angulatus]